MPGVDPAIGEDDFFDAVTRHIARPLKPLPDAPTELVRKRQRRTAAEEVHEPAGVPDFRLGRVR